MSSQHLYFWTSSAKLSAFSFLQDPLYSKISAFGTPLDFDEVQTNLRSLRNLIASGLLEWLQITVIGYTAEVVELMVIQ